MKNVVVVDDDDDVDDDDLLVSGINIIKLLDSSSQVYKTGKRSLFIGNVFICLFATLCTDTETQAHWFPTLIQRSAFLKKLLLTSFNKFPCCLC